MMKRFFVIALFVLGLGQLYAQPVRDTAWTKVGYFGLKLTQVSLSSWSAGGESALAFDSQITYSADFKRDRQLWQNRLELGRKMMVRAPGKQTIRYILLPLMGIRFIKHFTGVLY
jgi:hypothetical protein